LCSTAWEYISSAIWTPYEDSFADLLGIVLRPEIPAAKDSSISSTTVKNQKITTAITQELQYLDKQDFGLMSSDTTLKEYYVTMVFNKLQALFKMRYSTFYILRYIIEQVKPYCSGEAAALSNCPDIKRELVETIFASCPNIDVRFTTEEFEQLITTYYDTHAVLIVEAICRHVKQIQRIPDKLMHRKLIPKVLYEKITASLKEKTVGSYTESLFLYLWLSERGLRFN